LATLKLCYTPKISLYERNTAAFVEDRMQPIVSIIVLNYNGREDTLACLRSLEHLMYPNVNVVVVDNASHDGSVDAIREAHPQVALKPDQISVLRAAITLASAMLWIMVQIMSCSSTTIPSSRPICSTP
jgi:hypothetical protein